MNTINPHDPFGQIARRNGATAARPESPLASSPESGPPEAKPAPEPKPKRKYTRRIPPKTSPQVPVAKPEEQEPELVAAIFTTGELTIYVGDDVLHLTARQREKLEQFLGVTAPRVEASRKKDCDK